MKILQLFIVGCFLLTASNLVQAQVETKEDPLAKVTYTIVLKKKGTTQLKVKKVDLQKALFFTTNLGRILDYSVSFVEGAMAGNLPKAGSNRSVFSGAPMMGSTGPNTNNGSNSITTTTNGTNTTNTNGTNTTTINGTNNGTTGPNIQNGSMDPKKLQVHPARMLFEQAKLDSKIYFNDIIIVDSKGYLRAFNVEVTLVE